MTKTKERDWQMDWELCQRFLQAGIDIGLFEQGNRMWGWSFYYKHNGFFVSDRIVWNWFKAACEGWPAALERIRELEGLADRLGTQVSKARECIGNAYRYVDDYTMPQTAEPNGALLEQALNELRRAAQILDEAYREVSDRA